MRTQTIILLKSLAASAVLAASTAASAAPELVGHWSAEPRPNAKPGDVPPQLMHVRRAGSNYVIEVVEFIPAASAFGVREVPGRASEGGLRYDDRQMGDQVVRWDDAKKGPLGGVCERTCQAVSAEAYAAGKKSALAWKPKRLEDFIKRQ